MGSGILEPNFKESRKSTVTKPAFIPDCGLPPWALGFRVVGPFLTWATTQNKEEPSQDLVTTKGTLYIYMNSTASTSKSECVRACIIYPVSETSTYDMAPSRHNGGGVSTINSLVLQGSAEGMGPAWPSFPTVRDARCCVSSTNLTKLWIPVCLHYGI